MEEMIEKMVTTHDGMSIFVRAWIPEQPQRILVCVQGLGGHGGYYEEFAGQITPAGNIVVAPDLRGHGHSQGRRGDIDRFDRYLLDIDAAITWAMACWPNAPIFVLGESMGASLAIQYAVNRVQSWQAKTIPPILAGLVLVSPVLRPTIHPTVREIIQYIRSLLADPARPFLAVTGREEMGCRDSSFNAYLQADPLFVRLVSVRFLSKLGLWLRTTRKKGHLLHLPILVLQGGQDYIAHPRGTAAFLCHIPSKKLNVITFPQAYHCLLHDPDTPAVIKALAAWLADSRTFQAERDS
jgi:alpha-beta hydrolase superfamily lysophospholipase